MDGELPVMKTSRLVLALWLFPGMLHSSDLRVATDSRLSREFSDYLSAKAQHYLSARKTEISKLKTGKDVLRRGAMVREWMLRAIGGFPNRTPLNAKITGGFARPGYRVEHLVYESLPQFFVTANVYVPLGGKPPYPAVVGVAGHSDAGKASDVYQRVWISLARRGYVVIAFDPPGQGERSEYKDVKIGTRQHDMVGAQCLLTGTTFARYEAWDGVRAVDYLLTRSDVDPKRIAVAGNSGGGTQSAILGLVESRLATSVVSCYLTSWHEQFGGLGPQDAEQNFPGFLSAGFDLPDFLVGVAPKPVLMETATRDFFPISGARATYAEAKRLYGILDAEVKAGYFEYDDAHGWSKPRREAAYRWLDKWLRGVDETTGETDIRPEPAANLNATRTGQLQTSLRGHTVQSLNLLRAEQQVATRRALNAPGEEVRVLVRKLLQLPESIRKPRVEVLAREGGTSKLLLETESGLRIPAVLILPSGAKTFGAAIVIDDRGKEASAAEISRYIGQGTAVLAVDPRGWGESAPLKGGGGYSPQNQIAQRAMLLGRPLAAMQIFDVLSAYEYLRSHTAVVPSRISIYGRGHGGVIALYVAAVQRGISSVTARQTVPSYMIIARNRTHRGILGIVIPGILSHIDLPDLARAIAPRPLRIESPVDGESKPVPLDATKREYAAAAREYAARGAGNKIVIASAAP